MFLKHSDFMLKCLLLRSAREKNATTPIQPDPDLSGVGFHLLIAG